MSLKVNVRRIFKGGVLEWMLRSCVRVFGFNLLRHLVPSHLENNKGTIRYTQVDGINYKLDISSFNSWAIYWMVKAEKKPKKILYGLVKTDSIIIDIGAHMGETCMNMAKIAINGAVYGFEPHPNTYKNLQANILLNSFGNIRIFNYAIGESSGAVEMTNFYHNAGANRVTIISTDSDKGIELKTLDQFCNSENVNNIDLIKIDVEGFEVSVLKGCKETLDKFNPVLFIEMSDATLKEAGSSARELYQYLDDLGYKNIFDVRANEKITGHYKFDSSHTDIIAYPK